MEGASRNTAAPWVLFGGSALTGVLTSLITNKLAQRAIQDTPRMRRAELPGVLKGVGAPTGTPAVGHAEAGNAYYVQARDLPRLAAEDPEAYSKLRAALKKSQKQGYSPEGAMLYDPKLLRKGILAHEAGHAAIDGKPSVERVNQRYARPLSGLLDSVIAGLPAVAVGNRMHEWIPSAPLSALASGGVGAALGAAASLPTLWSEHGATSRALKHLERDPKVTPEQLEKERSALKAAFRTYLAGAMAAPAAAGVISSLYGSRGTKFQIAELSRKLF